MIPWVRGKFAERRARWLATRKQTSSPSPFSSQHAPDEPVASTSSGGDGGRCGNLEEVLLGELSASAAETPATRVLHNSSFDLNPISRCSPTFGLRHQGHPHIPSTALPARLSDIKPTPAAKPSNLIRISVLGADGKQLNIVVPADIQVHRVKVECIFLLEQIGSGHATHYKFFATRNQLQLNELHTLEEAGIVHNDELYLVRTITTSSSPRPANALSPQHSNNHLSFPVFSDQSFAPLQTDIDRVTSNMDRTDSVRLPIVNIEELVLQSDVQYDIRQMLISLSEASAYIIGMGTQAARLISLLKQKLASKHHQMTDSDDALEQLTGMGFEEVKVAEALRIHDGKFGDALNWLIDHDRGGGIENCQDNPSLTNIAALLAIVRIYCQKDIPPPDDMVRLIKDMGFDEPDVIEALKITKNNYSAACDWLIGNRATLTLHQRRTKGSAAADVSNNGLDGLPADSPILRALLSSPNVQLSLSNPKIFLAYISILEDYSSMGMWLGDGETSGTIGHILRTYHEEKHILAINQFVN